MQVDTEFFGDGTNLPFRTDQDRFDDAFLKGDHGAFERLLVARVRHCGWDWFQSFDHGQHLLIALLLVVDAYLRSIDFLHVRNLFGRRQNFRATHDLQIFLIGAHAIENDMLVVIEFLLGRYRDGNRVANGYRSCKMQGFVNQDGAGAGKQGAEHRRNQRAAPHAVGHDLAEHAAFGILRLAGAAVESAGQGSEKFDVLGH